MLSGVIFFPVAQALQGRGVATVAIGRKNRRGLPSRLTQSGKVSRVLRASPLRLLDARHIDSQCLGRDHPSAAGATGTNFPGPRRLHRN